jgi:hypothetical protein
MNVLSVLGTILLRKTLYYQKTENHTVLDDIVSVFNAWKSPT